MGAAFQFFFSSDSAKHDSDEETTTFLAWFKKTDPIVKTGFFISGLVALICGLLPIIPSVGAFLPDFHNLWIIITGSVFLVGGLSLAWAERNFFAEQHRNCSSMRMLYHSAGIRIDAILSQMEELSDKGCSGTWSWERLRSEVQDIIYNLGCEHLSENADWLIYHRARPLEPFMAG